MVYNIAGKCTLLCWFNKNPDLTNKGLYLKVMMVKSFLDLDTQPLFVKCEDMFGLPNFFLKIEGYNIAGSIKFKTANYIINDLEGKEVITPGKSKIIESSSGNLGIALSIICKVKNYPFTCVTDPNINKTTEKVIKAYGAEIIKVTQKDELGGYLNTRLRLIREMLEEDKQLVWTNQYRNQANVDAHYQTTAKEILKEVGQVDYLFIGSGTTGTLMGCAKYFRKHSPQTVIIAVEPVGSVTFGGESCPRHIPGIGTSSPPAITDSSLVDQVIYISEEDTVSMCNRFMEITGAMVGGSTGSVLEAVSIKSKLIPKDSCCIAICPDFGERYIDTVYNTHWVESNIKDGQYEQI